ncbi:MAG TPA: hypothetical protein VIH60_04870 [Steroidobacteraceae bacterium]
MELNLLFLPLLGGYLFYTRCYLTAYQARRCDGHRLIFHAAAIGLLFLLLARLIVTTSNVYLLDHNNRSIVTLGVVYLIIGSILSVGFAFAWMLVTNVITKRTGSIHGASRFALGMLIATVLGVAAAELVQQIPNGTRKALLYSALATLAIGGPWYVVSHRIAKLTSGRNFRVPAAGLLLRLSLLTLIAAFIALYSVAKLDEINAFWVKLSPFSDSATAGLAFALAVVGGWILNLLLPPEVAIEQVHRNNQSNPLERLFYELAVEQKLVQITLSEGKVYVGWIEWLALSPQALGTYMQILPLVSGYRDPMTKKFKITTYYKEFYTRKDFEPRDYVKVIPVATIVSAGAFREDVYADFQRMKDIDHDDTG